MRTPTQHPFDYFLRALRFVVVGLILSTVGQSRAYGQSSESEPNDTPQQANPVVCGDVLNGSISPVGDSDYFVLALPATTDLQIYTAVTAGDSVIELYADDGSTLITYDNDSGDGLGSQIGRAAQAGGTYYLRVRPFSASGTVTYTLTFLCPGYPLEVEPNGTLATATSVNCVSGGGTGDLAPLTDQDYWSITTTVPLTLSAISMSAPETVYQALSLYDAGGNLIGGYADYGAELGPRISRSLTAGTYYLRLSTRDFLSFHYNLRILLVGSTCTEVTSVVPTRGSQAGGEFVHITGSRFTTVEDTTVTFGGVPATVLSVTPDRITARTPAGTGTVDVRVANGGGAVDLPSAYTYVTPLIAARLGNVNTGLGDREDVLLVNAYQGDVDTREVTIGVHQPILVTMARPSSNSSTTHFALYAVIGPPNEGGIATLPRNVGTMAFPPPFMGGQPRAIWNNAGFRAILGAPTLPSNPAPSIVFRRTSGASRPVTLTFQGLIEDDGSSIPERWSVSNAVILRVL